MGIDDTLEPQLSHEQIAQHAAGYAANGRLQPRTIQAQLARTRLPPRRIPFRNRGAHDIRILEGWTGNQGAQRTRAREDVGADTPHPSTAGRRRPGPSTKTFGGQGEGEGATRHRDQGLQQRQIRSTYIRNHPRARDEIEWHTALYVYIQIQRSLARPGS